MRRPRQTSGRRAQGEVEIHKTVGPADTVRLGRRFARRLRAGDCVALSGPLGAGKTVLVRGIALGLGLADERMVSSPTFVLVQEYPCRIPVFHLDLYRLADAASELADLGVEEMLTRGAVLIEWADRAAAELPARRWDISIRLLGKSAREFSVRSRRQK